MAIRRFCGNIHTLFQVICIRSKPIVFSVLFSFFSRRPCLPSGFCKCVEQPAVVCQGCTVADDVPSRAEDCSFLVVVWQWLGDRDCTAQYNCCLPAITDCRRFCPGSIGSGIGIMLSNSPGGSTLQWKAERDLLCLKPVVAFVVDDADDGTGCRRAWASFASNRYSARKARRLLLRTTNCSTRSLLSKCWTPKLFQVSEQTSLSSQPLISLPD